MALQCIATMDDVKYETDLGGTDKANEHTYDSHVLTRRYLEGDSLQQLPRAVVIVKHHIAELQ